MTGSRCKLLKSVTAFKNALMFTLKTMKSDKNAMLPHTQVERQDFLLQKIAFQYF